VLVTGGGLAAMAGSLAGARSARRAASLWPGVPLTPAVLPITSLLAGFIVVGRPPSSARRHAPTPAISATAAAAASIDRAAFLPGVAFIVPPAFRYRHAFDAANGTPRAAAARNPVCCCERGVVPPAIAGNARPPRRMIYP